MSRQYWIHYSFSGTTFILTEHDDYSYNFTFGTFEVWERSVSYNKRSLKDYMRNNPHEQIEPISEKKLILMGVSLYEDK